MFLTLILTWKSFCILLRLLHYLLRYPMFSWTSLLSSNSNYIFDKCIWKSTNAFLTSTWIVEICYLLSWTNYFLRSGNFQPTAGPSTSTTTATNSINYATSNLPNTQQKQGSEKFTQNDFQKMILPMANLFNNSFLRFTHPNASPTPLYHTKGKENSVAINENNCSEPGTSSSTDIVGKKSAYCDNIKYF